MKYYRQAAWGAHRPFRLMIGLQEGYEANAKRHSLSEVQRAFQGWMRRRKDGGQPYLTGTIHETEVVYVRPGEGEGQPGNNGIETVVIIEGDVYVRYHTVTSFSDEAVVEALNDLAETLGLVTNQFRIPVSFMGQSWVLERAPDS